MTIRFYTDDNVQRLGKWLRFAGFDTFYRKELSLQKIDHLCQKERRIFITRSHHKDIKRFGGRVETLSTSDIYQQIDTILKKYPVSKDNIASRCIRCNVLLRPYLQPNIVNPDHPRPDSKYCPRCGKIFWKGSHYDAMYLVIEKYLL